MSLIKVTSIVHPSGTSNNITLDNAGNATLAGDLTFTSGSLAGTATAGTMEYDGKALYMTPQGTQRGIVPGQQFFRLEANLVGSNVNTAQNLIGVGVTLSSSTIYEFEGLFLLNKSAGVTSHTNTFQFGGTATINNINYWIYAGDNATGQTTGMSAAGTNIFALLSTAGAAVIGARSSATLFIVMKVRGTVSINSGGTFIPQYLLSAAPGGAYTTSAGSYFNIYPIGTSGSNTSVGTWA